MRKRKNQNLDKQLQVPIVEETLLWNARNICFTPRPIAEFTSGWGNRHRATLDTYSHVLPGLQDAAAESFDRLLDSENEVEKEETNVCKMFAKDGDLASEPRRTRTSNRLIKRLLVEKQPVAC